GGGDVDARFGAANGRQQRRVVARRQRATGLAAEDADHLIARRARFVAVGGQRGTGSALLLPMLIEQLLELTHRRSRDLKVGVVPGLVRALLRLRGRSERAALVGGTEIDAADDCDPAVEELPWRRYRADAVVNHIDLHAAALPRDQQIAELLAIVLDLLEGVVLQVQIALCRVNGGEGPARW